MKAVEYQNDLNCARFKENTIRMNKTRHSLITTPPVPGCAFKHSRMLKSHLLFDWEISDLLLTWRTLGTHNIEGTHPLFNQLVRKFGNTRGDKRQKLVMKELLFANSTWTVETINTMLIEARMRVVRDKEERTENPNNKLTETDAIDFALGVATDMEGKEGVADEALIERELGDADEGAVDMKDDGEVEEEEEGMLLTPLLGLDTAISENMSFHDFGDVNTRIYV
jgi:hypothetical protein